MENSDVGDMNLEPATRQAGLKEVGAGCLRAWRRTLVVLLLLNAVTNLPDLPPVAGN